MSAVSFDPAGHAYTIDGAPVKSVTQLLKAAGLISDRWYDEDSAARGTAVHSLCAEHDMGVLTPEFISPYRGYVLGWVHLSNVLRPAWTKIEQATGCPKLKLAGRIDRVGAVYNRQSVADLKTGPPEPWHRLQLALAAILEADELHLPPEQIGRYSFYLKPDGKFLMVEHANRHDLTVAYQVIRAFV